MNSPFQACNACGQPFWALDANGEALALCPICTRAAAVPVPHEMAGGEHDDGPPRFVSLSALPPDRRMPRREDGYRPGLFVPRRLEEISGGPPSRPAPPPPVPSPALAPPTEPRLGFNCPSCFAVLFIKDPVSYDGRAAPCPYCAVTIIPPRIAPATPFILLAHGPAQSELPPPRRVNRWKPFKQDDFSGDAALVSAGDGSGE